MIFVIISVSEILPKEEGVGSIHGGHNDRQEKGKYLADTWTVALQPQKCYFASNNENLS